jgi:epoxide hydrolase 4
VHPVDDVVTHNHATINGVRLHWVEAGEGPLVVLLHGFPEFWYSWRNQIPALAAAGYRVIAPDLRGFARSEKPRSLAQYRPSSVTGDIVGLIHEAGEERATVVGHDWGGAVSWLLATSEPAVVERLVIVNSPHPAVMIKSLRRPDQLFRSSYMAVFNVPLLPELALRAGEFAALRWFLRAATKPGALTDADLDRYVEAWAIPGSLSGGLAYYRAMGRAIAGSGGRPASGRAVTAPTLVIWGRNDPVLPPHLADPGGRVPHRRVEMIDDAGHFVQADAPERVNQLLLGFLSESRAGAPHS